MTRAALLRTAAAVLVAGALAVSATLIFLAASAETPPAAVGSGHVTVWDEQDPEVANLDADLLSALRDAASDAEADGIRFNVNSGWRTPEDQQRLLDEAVVRYGSEAEAARWVASPQTSAHVSGDAVDIGSTDAVLWLADHGARYGLCQVYENEPWHFELRTDAASVGCPRTYHDPTHDPRMG